MPWTRFYLSPFYRLKKKCGHTSSTPTFHTAEGVALNTWRRPVAYGFLYRLYMQKDCRSDFFKATLCGLSSQCSHCWPQTFVLKRLQREFSISLEEAKGQRVSFVCVCRCVCTSLLFVCCTWKAEVGVCMIDFLENCVYLCIAYERELIWKHWLCPNSLITPYCVGRSAVFWSVQIYLIFL